MAKKFSLEKCEQTHREIKAKKPQEVFSLILTKPFNGPIIYPKPENDWEAWQTFNSGVILLENNIHFLYRAIGKDGISRLGYAVSGDGFKIDERLSQPVYRHHLTNNPSFNLFSFNSGGSFGGCEDPRPVRVNKEDKFYMTYTACDSGIRVSLTSIKVEDFLNKKWRWKKPVLLSPPGQVHKNWVIFPEKINGRYAILHALNPQISIDFFDSLEFDGKTYINSCYEGEPQGNHWNWESMVRGVGPSPLKTKEGWLIFYHGEDKNDPGKYKVGTMLLDLKEPRKVLCCSKKPVLEANNFYDNDGFKPGVVYASGAVIKGNKLLVYYGCADSYVCIASADLNEFLTQLKKEGKSELKEEKLKEKKDDN